MKVTLKILNQRKSSLRICIYLVLEYQAVFSKFYALQLFGLIGLTGKFFAEPLNFLLLLLFDICKTEQR